MADQECDEILYDDTDLVVVTDKELPDIVAIIDEDVVTISDCVGVTGLPGPPGTGGSFDCIAGEALQAYRAVFLAPANEVFLADKDVLSDAHYLLGITKTAALTGEDVTVVSDGILVTSATWVPGPLYLGDGGTLVSTPASAGFHLQVAVAIDSSTLIVRPQFTIVLA